MDAFGMNINGVRNLVGSGTNKTSNNEVPEEGIQGDFEDVLTLKMDDSELIVLRDQWEKKSATYLPGVEARQKRNKAYYLGKQKQDMTQRDIPVSSNLIFEAEETFIPQALAKNPEPVVWSDNTEEGKVASNDIKTMLQYHADTMCLRKKLGKMLRHWSVYFVGIAKHGWDSETNDITTQVRKPKNFILDPDGFIDEFGNFTGDYLGERIKITASDLVEMFPKHKDYITVKANGMLGTNLTYTEWWTNEYCFSTFEDEVLDKHRNQFFNYDTEEEMEIDGIVETTVTPGQNHFATPKMPYTFLSVFSLDEQPYDETNLIEQNIPNQDRINDRDDQIDINLRQGNNSMALSGQSFNSETAKQAANALQNGDPVLVPDGQVDSAIKRIPANEIPSSVFNAQQNDKDTLRAVFGVQGLSATASNDQSTARGMILEKQYDSTRIGGGVGDALEQVADNIFNWWLQLFYVFYDEPHYAAIMGNGRAVEYVQLLMMNQQRKFVVSVTPNSMTPKDEISEMNQAIDLANNGWLDPITLFKKLNYPDPMETAKMVTIFRADPMMYLQMFFPESAPPMMGQPMDTGQISPQGAPDESMSAPAPNPSLSQVPLNQ